MATSAISKATPPIPGSNGNGLGGGGVDYSTASNLSYSNPSNGGRGGMEDRAITSPKSTSSNHSTRADFSGRESNGNVASPSTAESSQHLGRDRSRSPPPSQKSQTSAQQVNGSISMSIKEELETSPNKLSGLDATNTNLLAANYFANSHLKLAENLISHGGTANFLNSTLMPNKGSGDIRTSPGGKTEDEGSATPLSSHHHPMGGFERKEFDLSKVNGEWAKIIMLDWTLSVSDRIDRFQAKSETQIFAIPINLNSRRDIYIATLAFNK